MKRAISLITYFLILLAVQTGFSQTWPVALTMDPYPSPFLSDWQTDPNLAALEITNPTSKPDVVIVDLEVTSSQGARFQGTSQRLLINPEQTVMMNTTEFSAWYTGILDKNARDKAVRTGMMPEGSYEACVSVKNLWGVVLAQNVCAFFTVVHAEPPELIYPAIGQEVTEPYPVFQWIPPQLPSAKQAIFTFRLVRILQGQTPDLALSANYPHYENFYLQESNLEYPLDGLPLEPGAFYAWQIQALDFDGKPITKNDGRSPIGTFTTSTEMEGVLTSLQLSYPENQAYISTYPIEFQWMEPAALLTGQLQYEIRIAPIGRGQTPLQAMRENNALYTESVIVDQTSWTYPAQAPAFNSGSSYAWQVEARDEFGIPATANEGLSEVWMFTTALTPGEQNLKLPERLPLGDESIAYIELLRNGAAIVEYEFSPDSATVELQGSMTLLLPALQTGSVPPQLTVNGRLSFDRTTLNITGGQIQGYLPAEKGSALNLDASGTPLVITQVAYSAGQNNQIECKAVPILLGRIIATVPVDVALTSDGSLQANISAFISESVSLVPNSDKLQLELGQLTGTIHASPAWDLSDNHLALEAELVIAATTQSARIPVLLQFDEAGAGIKGAIYAQQAIDLDLDKLILGLSDLACHTLRFNRATQSWSFDLGFELTMEFKEIGVTLPAVHDVHMSRFGIEIPQISIADLGEQTARSFAEYWITARAFRMYSYTFNWYRWNGGDIGDWGFFWDLDIQLPHLPQHLSQLDATPFRANNATYVNGAFQGLWNPRTFEPAVFVPMAGENLPDAAIWGLAIHEIKGGFSPQTGASVQLGVKADWIPPHQVILNTPGEIVFTPEQLVLSPKGVFTGRLESISLSRPIPWGVHLTIHSRSADLVFEEIQGQQNAFLRIHGAISLPTPSGATVAAIGAGTFDLFSWRLATGQFTVQTALTIALPFPDHLIALECKSGAVVDPLGLHLTELSDTAHLSSGESISCQAGDELLLALPGWEILSGTLLFRDTFSLALSDWRLGVNGMTWQTRPAAGDAQTNVDNLFLPLPQFPRLDGSALIATGRSRAMLHFKNQRHAIDADFSNDFFFSLTPPSVKRGQVQFSIADQRVALLDSNGLHLGDYFGVSLASEKIGLPDTSIAYIDMSNNPNLSLIEEGGLKRIRHVAGRLATVHFPSLKYQKKSVPTIQAQVDISIDPSTHQLTSGSVLGEGTPLLSLAEGRVPLQITKLNYTSGKWTASVQPILPPALGQNRLTVSNVDLDASGLRSFDSGYSSFAGAPQDSAVLGEYLTVTLDGVRAICGGQLPIVYFSGDFRSPAFTGYPIHYTCSLTTDSASFAIKTLNVEPPLGCGRLMLIDKESLPTVEASMSSPDFTVALCAVWKLNSLSTGFELTLPRLEIRGNSVTLKQTESGTQAQTCMLFGTKITIKKCTLQFSTPAAYELVLDGSMLVFGKLVDFTGLRIPNGCSVADALLAQMSGGIQLNPQMSLQKLETRSGNLLANLKIFLPQPFDVSRSDTLSLAILPDGTWLDGDGSALPERKYARETQELTAAPCLLLGNEKFHLNAYLSAVTVAIDGADNTSDEGSIGFRVDTYWPQKELIGAADSVCVRAEGLCQFTASTVSQSWSLSQDTPVDTITTVMDNDFYLHAATFSMADTSVFQIHFNGIMQLPLPADIINGQVELVDNRIGPGLFEFGKLHTAQIYLAGLNFELFDFHFVRNELVDFKEIEFTQRVASVENTQIMADLYLSFGAKMATDFPGLEFGVDRLVIFKSKDQFHLLVEHATIWIGDKFYFDLDLVGSIWEGDKAAGEKTQFKWLIGGNMDFSSEGSKFKGGAVVGEISYREVIGVNKQVDVCPGFGLFVSANVEIDLTPIPVKLLGFGAGFFFNPSREIRDMVYYHTMGYDELENKEICDEFKAVMDAMQDDMMTAVEIYLYGAGAIPDENVLQGKILLTLASDRIKVNAKVWPSDKVESLKGIIDLAGFIEAECAWSQDFSSFKYLAGHFKLGGRASVEEKYILKCPESAQVMLDFIVTGKGDFGISGRLMTETLSCHYLTAECDFTFGNPGFVFYGKVGMGYNMYIIRVEAGMELSIYLKWFEPVKFGIYADCYVEGCVIDDWLAGFRGEMGAALVVEPDLFLYGYAELTGKILGISKTVRVWAKWEEGGELSSGTGSDPTLEQLVAESQSIADEIMTNLQDLKAEMSMLGVLQYGNLTSDDIAKIVQNIGTGKYDGYIKTWDEDYTEFGNAVVDELEKVEDFKEVKTQQMGAFFDKLIALRNAMTNEGFYPLLVDMQRMEPGLANLKSSLQERITGLQDICDALITDMDAIDFTLDTLLVLTDIEASPIQNPLSYSYTTIEGVRAPEITFDETIDAMNLENVQKLQQVLEGWLVKVETNIQKMRQGRDEIYKLIGPGSSISDVQGEFINPMLSANSEFINSIHELNASFSKCYNYYGNIPFPWDADEIFLFAAENEKHCRLSNLRRQTALIMLEIPTGTLPSNEVDRYRVLGNLFYRTMPHIVLSHYLSQADSLMHAFEQGANGLQANLDKIHQTLTANTDFIWDKYAELSEKVYGILDRYQSAAKSLSAGGENLFLQDSTASIMSSLQEEFTYPTFNPVMSVNQPEGFLPVTAVLDCQSNQPEKIAEYAVSLDGRAFQSMGHKNRLDRDYMLRHGVSYMLETYDGGVGWPIVEAERRLVTMSPRIRNKAGLTTIAGTSRIDMSGKNWKYATAKNEVIETIRPDSIYRCIVQWPYPKAVLGGITTYHCSATDELTLKWWLYNNYGVWGFPPAPVRNRITLKQGEVTVFGPQDFPVTQTGTPDTFRVRLENLHLTANNGEPCRAIIQAYDATGVLLGTSSGSIALQGQRDDGSIFSVEQRWNEPMLFIDTTPPVISGAGEYFNIGDTRHVIYRLPKAKDEVRIHSGVYTEWISDPAEYEYQLLSWNAEADSSAWQNLENSDLISSLPPATAYNQDIHTMSKPGSNCYFLNFAPHVFADSLKYIVRARNSQAQWNTGVSEPATFLIPKSDETGAPTPATFKMVGLDENRNLNIEILQPGQDDLSGISHYPWRLSQNLYKSTNPYVTVWNPQILRFAADMVRNGALLTIPVPHDSIDINNAFTVELYTFDRCGNLAMTVQEFHPEPAAPIVAARLLEGLKPFTLVISGAIQPLSDHYIDSVAVHIGTAPDRSDIIDRVISFSELAKMLKGDQFVWSIELPASVQEGTSIYLSLVNIRHGVRSRPYAQRIQIYRPMFAAVETDANGYLVLPILNSAFNGQREATFKWAIGYLAPQLSGQDRYQLNIQSLTTLQGYSSDQIMAGAQVRLPIKAADVRPLSLVVLQATALDGEIHATYHETAIIPPKPEIKATLTLDEGDYHRFFYRLQVQARFGTLLQTGGEVAIEIGSKAGACDIQKTTVQLVSGTQDGFTFHGVFLDSATAKLPRLHLTAFSKTAAGTLSRDSTSLSFDVPWPSFWREPGVTFDGYLSVQPLRSGYRDVNEISGYQFAIGDGSGTTFNLRPYPADLTALDIPNSGWVPGGTITLNYSVQGLPCEIFRVGIRTVRRTGQTNEEIHISKPFLQPRVNAEIVGTFPQIKLHVQADLGPEMAAQMSMKELRLELKLNDASQFYRTLTVPDNGSFEASYDLPSMPWCQTYQFRSFFWHTASGQFASYVTELEMPCPPMFTAVDANSEDMVYLDLIHSAFSGERPVAGYQFGIGSSPGTQDVRPFPQQGQWDFTPEQAGAGSRLILPQSLTGLPANGYVTLRGFDMQGRIHATEQAFQARPPQPKVTVLYMENNGRFTVRFDQTRFDAKVRYLNCWIKSVQDPDRVISFNEFQASELQTGIVKFDSQFAPGDVDQEFIFAGLSLGYQINSLEFQYHFRITKLGDGYRILAL